MQEQLYIQTKKYAHIHSDKLTIKDVSSILCNDRHITDKVNSLCIYKFKGNKNKRIVISSLYILDYIQANIPNIVITPIGATDTVVKYDPNPSKNKLWELVKVAFISLTIFLGAGFSIVAFNTDIDLNNIFSTLHDKLNFKDTTNFAIMEIAYSVGIPLGITLFYNHFGNKKLSTDPTPLEIEMRLYENDINTAIVDGNNRKEDV